MTTSFEKNLIKLVKKQKYLYYTRSRSNFNKAERAKAWTYISEQLQRPVNECTVRWRSLRNRYLKEKKKAELSNDDIEKSDGWELYDDMRFIEPFLQLKMPPKTSKATHETLLDPTNSYDEPLTLLPDDFSFAESLQNTPSTTKDSSANSMIRDGNVDTSLTDMTIKSSVSQMKKELIDLTAESGEFENPEASASMTVYSDTSETNQTTLQNVLKTKQTDLTIIDSNAACLDLKEGFNTTLNARFAAERDDNDIFLEFIGKKMKALSEEAKLRIQGKLFANVTEELLKNKEK